MVTYNLILGTCRLEISTSRKIIRRRVGLHDAGSCWSYRLETCSSIDDPVTSLSNTSSVFQKILACLACRRILDTRVRLREVHFRSCGSAEGVHTNSSLQPATSLPVASAHSASSAAPGSAACLGLGRVTLPHAGSLTSGQPSILYT